MRTVMEDIVETPKANFQIRAKASPGEHVKIFSQQNQFGAATHNTGYYM